MFSENFIKRPVSFEQSITNLKNILIEAQSLRRVHPRLLEALIEIREAIVEDFRSKPLTGPFAALEIHICDYEDTLSWVLQYSRLIHIVLRIVEGHVDHRVG